MGHPGLTLLLAYWLSWQDLTNFLLHLGNHGTHGKIPIKTLLSSLRYKQLRLKLNTYFTQRLFQLVFIIKMPEPAETKMHAKVREKVQ